MAAITFGNTSGGFWNVAGNWDPVSLPDGNSQVTFASGTYTSVVDGGPWSIQSLNVNVVGVTLQIDVDLDTQTLSGNLGTINVQSGAIFTVHNLNSSNGAITVSDNAIFTVNNLNGNYGNITAGSSGIVNLAGNGSGDFTVAGGILKIDGNFNGSGLITMDTGILWITGQLGNSSYDLDDGGVDHVFFDSLQNTTANTISGADLGDRLAIKNVQILSKSYLGTTLTLNTDGGTFVFTNVTLAAGLVAAATIGTVNFQGSSYGYIELACFAEGTLIDTPGGPCAVEALREGMQVRTAAGGSKPVRWIGMRRLDLRRHPDPASAQPIRIMAGALADGVPRRDLLVSPAHAMFVDGLLVPAQLLVNGATIRHETACQAVTYYHVELDTHDVLLAEGAPTESYLDTGNRHIFENAAQPLMLHPDLTGNDGKARRSAASCAPFAEEPAQVRPVWAKLAERAKSLNLTLPHIPTVANPDICLEVDGRRVLPMTVGDGQCVFMLPANRSNTRLISRASIPHELYPWVSDPRRLGVAVHRLTVRHNDEVWSIPLDHPALRRGWWDLEGDARHAWRWTDGAAVLPLQSDGPLLLTVEYHPQTAYRAPLQMVSVAA